MILPGAAAAFGIFLARQFFIGIPDELIEAARIDGAGQLRIFLQVVLPLCKPLIAVLTLLTLMGSWNDFAWPLIALKDNELFTLPIGLLYLKDQTSPDYNVDHGAGADLGAADGDPVPRLPALLRAGRSPGAGSR